MPHKEIPVKYNIPNSFSHAPYKSICKVVFNYSEKEPELYKYYIQKSTDETKPEWEEMGHILSSVFEPFFNDDEFINKCLCILGRIIDPDKADLDKIKK